MSGKFYEKFEKKPSHKKSSKEGRTNQHISQNNSENKIEKKADGAKSPKKNSRSTAERKPGKQGKQAHMKSNDKIITPCQRLFETDKLTKETEYILQNFDEIVQGVRPLNSKQLQQLPDNIKALSHQLTDKRSERRLGYMNDSVQLSSYVRYYTWWNLVRLTRLFSNMPAESFPDKDDICIDLGTGPLTVVNALWLARPELRKLKLTWYCLDVSANSMVLGEDIFMSIAARTITHTIAEENGHEIEPWNIIRVKGSFGTSIKQKADFITCANMFNELDQAGDMPPEYQSKKYFEQLKNYGNNDCKYLLIEPGVPKATRTITLLRDRFIGAGKKIAAPCPHHEQCPMNGFKAYTGSQNKWCNFCFSTENAPAKLLKLSENAKLPKERATLIFVSAVPKNKENKKADETYKQDNSTITCRITSDPFKLPEYKIGYYGCSRFGLTLIKTTGKIEKVENKKGKKQQGPEKNFIIKGPLASGDLIQVKIKAPDFNLKTDEKSGAVIIEL